MGYACPVCDDPQADAAHLANHLAFTALTSGGDHEAWLDEHVSDWDQLGETELADRVVEHAPETEYPQVFEASGVEAGRGPGDHGHETADHGVDLSRARERGSAEVDETTREIVDEAREMSPDGTEGADEGDGDRATEDAAAGDDRTEDETE